MLRSLRPFYRLADKAEYWFRTLHRHLTIDLNMQTDTFDPALFYSNLNSYLNEVPVTYADYIIHTGTK